MASFTVHIPKNLEDQLAALANIDAVAPKMIEEAAPIYAEAIRRRLQPHRDTGQLIASVTPHKAARGKDGAWRGTISFDGTATGEKGQKKPNAVKAQALEYGSSKQTATPYMDAAKNDAEPAVIEKMQEVYNRETR